jgi:hypothetical protein
MWCCVGLVLTDVSEEHIDSIFRVAKFASEALALPKPEKQAKKRGGKYKLNIEKYMNAAGIKITRHEIGMPNSLQCLYECEVIQYRI